MNTRHSHLGLLFVLVLTGCGSSSKGDDLGQPSNATGGTLGSGGSSAPSGGSSMTSGGSGSTAKTGGTSGLGGVAGALGGGAGALGGGAGGAGAATSTSAGESGRSAGGDRGGVANGGGDARGGVDAGGSSSTTEGGKGVQGGAASGSAGAAGAGTAGAADAGSSCSQVRNALFCEDFESLMPGPAVAANGWSTVTNNGSLTIDGAHATGKNALHVHTQGNGRAFIQLSPFAPPGNSFFGRMRAWVTAFPSAPDYAHFTLVETSGSQPGFIRPIGGQYIPGKGVLWGTGSDGGPTGDWTNWKESAPAEAGKPLCLEWQLAASDNAIKVWINGEEKADLFVNTKQHGGSAVDFVFPTLNSIWFGWWLYQAGSTPPDFDLWLDDIALSSQKLGC